MGHNIEKPGEFENEPDRLNPATYFDVATVDTLTKAGLDFKPANVMPVPKGRQKEIAKLGTLHNSEISSDLIAVVATFADDYREALFTSKGTQAVGVKEGENWRWVKTEPGKSLFELTPEQASSKEVALVVHVGAAVTELAIGVAVSNWQGEEEIIVMDSYLRAEGAGMWLMQERYPGAQYVDLRPQPPTITGRAA